MWVSKMSIRMAGKQKEKVAGLAEEPKVQTQDLVSRTMFYEDTK